jgi:hypothetical protein
MARDPFYLSGRRFVDRGNQGGITEVPDERHQAKAPTWPVVALFVVGSLVALAAYWLINSFLSYPGLSPGG